MRACFPHNQRPPHASGTWPRACRRLETSLPRSAVATWFPPSFRKFASCPHLTTELEPKVAMFAFCKFGETVSLVRSTSCGAAVLEMQGPDFAETSPNERGLQKESSHSHARNAWKQAGLPSGELPAAGEKYKMATISYFENGVSPWSQILICKKAWVPRKSSSEGWRLPAAVAQLVRA